ncbi:hypothetical protein Tco_1257139 [Tanacetum coccineum]
MFNGSEALADTYLFALIFEWVISKLFPVVGYYFSWQAESAHYVELDFARAFQERKDFLYKLSFIMAYLLALRRMALASFFPYGRIPSARWAKLVDVILLSAFAFLFSPLGTCLMENSLKVLARVLNFSRYCIIPDSFAILAINASYSTSLLVALNLNLRAHANSTPSGFISISPALEPSMHDDPSVNNIHGSKSSSLSSIGVS